MLVLSAGLLMTLLSVGCAQQWHSTVLPTNDQQLAFRAAYDVIDEDYTIASADQAEGIIRSKPLEYMSDRDAQRSGAYVSTGATDRVRRSVTFRLKPIGGPGLRGDLVVDVERENTSQAERMLITQDIHERPSLGFPRRLNYLDEETAVNWAYVGRDKEAERILLSRIESRIQQMRQGGQVPPLEPQSPADGEATAPIAPQVPVVPVTPLEEPGR